MIIPINKLLYNLGTISIIKLLNILVPDWFNLLKENT